jgi:hypothetical protein
MKVYSVRKRRGQWAVCAEDTVVMHFDSYEEALETARAAVAVLIDRLSPREPVEARWGDGPAPAGPFIFASAQATSSCRS